jgi:alanine racemase
VVVHGAALIIRIGAAVFMLTTIMMEMMMVDVSNPAAFGKVGCKVLLVLNGMLNICTDQRHNARCLGQ